MIEQNKTSLRYKDAGVDIDAGDAFVKAIKPLTKSTKRAGAAPNLGGFGAIFDLKATGYKDPLLIAATDGVGTKLKLGLEAGHHKTMGQDLVAMCVNDLVVQGAEPLFFLDYMASGKLDIAMMHDVVAGIAEACRQSGAALIGGETAEMPGLYQGEDYDLAGFAVGAVERESLITPSLVQEGDILLGLASSGPHANGFSLIRHILTDQKLTINDKAPFAPEQNLADLLLPATRLYVRSCLAALKNGGVHGMAHITGGGFLDNVPRVLPKGFKAHIKIDNWSLPPVFEWLRSVANLTPSELARTFNCGIGMVMIVAPKQSQTLINLLKDEGESVFILGEIESLSDPDAPPLCALSASKASWGMTGPWYIEGTKE